ncbi:MAG: ribbon-helix-helix domain-containing protein [Bacteroidota bacterium]
MPKTEKEIITTYITKEQKIFLENKSERTGIPQAELIRRAINNYITKEE